MHALEFSNREQFVNQKVLQQRNASHCVAYYTNGMERRFYLKEWLKHLNLRQADLVTKLDSSKGYISEITSGKKRFNQDMLEEIAGALGVQPYQLLTHPDDSVGPHASVPQKPIDKGQVAALFRLFMSVGMHLSEEQDAREFDPENPGEVWTALTHGHATVLSYLQRGGDPDQIGVLLAGALADHPQILSAIEQGLRADAR